MKKVLLLGAAVLPLVLFGSDKDPVVANVNGSEIHLSELEQNYQQNLMLVTDKTVTKEKVLNDLINRELGIQRAKAEKLQNEPIVKKKMEDVLYHAKISKDLEPLLKRIQIADKDVSNYYKSHPEYRTAHILFRISVKAPTEEDSETVKKAREAEWQEAQKAARQVYAELQKNPEKWAELANKYSQSSSAPNGGDLGFQPAIRLAPEYFAAINGKSVGTVLPPVRTQFGYHIIKILAKREEKDINQQLYKKIVYDQKRDKILEDYFKELRSTANIKINKELLK